MAECEICDLPLDQCAHSPAAKAAAKADDPVETGPTISARITSRCGACDDLMEQGDRITYTDVGWVHTRHVYPPDVPDQFAGFDL